MGDLFFFDFKYGFSSLSIPDMFLTEPDFGIGSLVL